MSSGHSTSNQKCKILQPTILVFTGAIDEYFRNEGIDRLGFRSLRFEIEHHDTSQYQPVTTVNYPELDIPWSRITEPKISYGYTSHDTTIIKEFPSAVGEPFYPILTPAFNDLAESYRAAAARERTNGIFFLGRLAQFRYLNMDRAVENALSSYESILKKNYIDARAEGRKIDVDRARGLV